MAGHPRDIVRLKEIRVELNGGGQTMLHLHHFELQVRTRELSLYRQKFEMQIAETRWPAFMIQIERQDLFHPLRLLQDESDLEQRRPARIAIHLQFLRQQMRG